MRQYPHLPLTNSDRAQNGQKQTAEASVSWEEVKTAKTQPIDSSFRHFETLLKSTAVETKAPCTAATTNSPFLA
jgi:hypothetical protein